MIQNFFGKVKNDLQGFSAEQTFEIPYFKIYKNAKSVKVYLGNQYDEEWEKIETPPTQKQLDEYEKTLKSFLIEIDKVVVDIKEKSFEYYKERYARYYEVPFEVLFENDKIQNTENGQLHPPLNIDNEEKHFEYMNEILESIRISNNGTIIIPILYDLDEEHQLALKIVNNKVEEIDGIGEVY
ncbi:hypothetical protein B0I22_1488 [Epilithonimonas xixisoli]|uniref:Uncharacterized protein n=2 Tax=Epilithonimonas xixisoli TaxID=1476462 RepID=A0A4R8ICC4_9FLAO|nr:hypothetical protein B0I22_1488 [Epilithonimonas xixisoli]